MARSSIISTLSRMKDFLEIEAVFLLSSSMRTSLLEKTDALLQKAASPGDLLYVGILGGTGVGKSTLINALARKEVSTPSDRRPFTDLAVLYRHRNTTPPLENIQHLIRKPDPVHDSALIEDLVLIDLPDFDSRDSANRAVTLEILPVLDCTIWVVSPEKYADAALYDFIKQTIINRENFTFVLNKADELITTEGRHQDLKEVLGDFVFRLRHEADIDQPRVFSVSALDEFLNRSGDSALKTEFEKFRNFLLAKRDAKEIVSIKNINLREESVRLLDDLNHEIRIDELTRLVTSIQEKRQDLSEEENLRELQSIELEKGLSQGVLQFLIREDVSLEPVLLGMRLLSFFRGIESVTDPGELDRTFHDTIRQSRDVMQRRAERLTDSTDTELILALRPETLPPLKDSGELMQQAEKEASAFFLSTLRKHERVDSGFRRRAVRLGQKFLLSLPLIVLIFKLIGPGTIAEWWKDPSFSGMLGMGFHVLGSLFGAEGLIGMIVLFLCELGLVGYMATRRFNYLEKKSATLVRDTVVHMSECLQRAVREIVESRTEATFTLQKSLSALRSLNATAFPAPTWKHIDIHSKPTETGDKSAGTEGQGVFE